ncbi:hypothetical protein NHJ13734_009794 [Beauveria thailandica]
MKLAILTLLPLLAAASTLGGRDDKGVQAASATEQKLSANGDFNAKACPNCPRYCPRAGGFCCGAANFQCCNLQCCTGQTHCSGDGNYCV